MGRRVPLLAAALAGVLVAGCSMEAPKPVTAVLENAGGGALLVIAYHDRNEFASDGDPRFLDLEGRRSDDATTEFRLTPSASRTLRLALHQETVVNPHPPSFAPRVLRERYAQATTGRLRVRNLGEGTLDVAIGNDVTRPDDGFRLAPGEAREVDVSGVQVRLNPQRGLENLRDRLGR
mgnify:CR=1 FL=1